MLSLSSRDSWLGRLFLLCLKHLGCQILVWRAQGRLRGVTALPWPPHPAGTSLGGLSGSNTWITACPSWNIVSWMEDHLPAGRLCPGWNITSQMECHVLGGRSSPSWNFSSQLLPPLSPRPSSHLSPRLLPWVFWGLKSPWKNPMESSVTTQMETHELWAGKEQDADGMGTAHPCRGFSHFSRR